MIIKTPHYQVSAQGLPAFYARVLESGLQCVLYPPDRSFVKPGSFLRIWNHGTPEWNDIKDEYNDCNFHVARSASRNFDLSSRGNHIMSFGFTGQSHQLDPTTFVQKPAMLVGTHEWNKHMQCLSSLQSACGAHPRPTDSRRFREFGQRIHPDNFLEGFSVGATQVFTENVRCHMDTHNDKLPGASTVIVASEIKDSVRVIQGGYFKSCISAYYCRVDFTSPAIRRASELLREIQEWESSSPLIGPQVFRSQQQGLHAGVLCPTNPTPPASIDKAVQLAPFVHILVDLISTFSLTFDQKLEALLPVGFISTREYWNVASRWIHSNKLPTKNLTLAFLEITVNNKTTGSSQSLPPFECIESSLWNLGYGIKAVNSCRTNRHSYHRLVSYLQTTTLLGVSQWEDVVTVGVLAGVVRHPILANQACLLRSTPTLVAIKSTFGCDTIQQACGLVKSAAKALDITPAISHALFRQMLKLDQCYALTYSDSSEFNGPTVFCAGARKAVRTTRKTSNPKPRTLHSRSTSSSTLKCRRPAVVRRTLPSRSTRSSTLKRPITEMVMASVIPWAEVVLLRDASEQVCIHPILDGSLITYIKEVPGPGSRVYWRATCRVNGVTWNPNDDHVSSKFGGLAHSSYHPPEGGSVVYNSKSTARDSLLVYMLVHGSGPSFEWVRRCLGDHHFVRIRKKNNPDSAEPLFLIYRHKGDIFIGHYKDRWHSRTKLCKV
jgi:hypothetical protein